MATAGHRVKCAALPREVEGGLVAAVYAGPCDVTAARTPAWNVSVSREKTTDR